jgi:hypothetical protein
MFVKASLSSLRTDGKHPYRYRVHTYYLPASIDALDGDPMGLLGERDR